MKSTLKYTVKHFQRVWSTSIFDNDRVSPSLWRKKVRSFYQDGQRLLYDDSDWEITEGMGTFNIFIDGRN